MNLLSRPLHVLIPVSALLLLAACAEPAVETPAMAPTYTPEPLPMETRADSVAARVLDAMGGREAWDSLRYLSFDFATDRDGERVVRRSHLWDRHTGDYRVEWPAGGDTTITVLFNVDTREGTAYANGTPLEGEAADEALTRAYRSFINDTYWLLMPVKLFDPGVTRTYDAEESDEDTDVIRITFDDVGLTPGDTYWVYVDRETGMVEQWAMVLQGNPDAEPRVNEWTEYERFEAPGGAVMISTRKNGLLTDNVETPASVPRERFTQP